MNTHTDDTQPYWIAHPPNEQEKVHYGQISDGQEVATNRTINTYATEQEWIDALQSTYNITPETE